MISRLRLPLRSAWPYRRAQGVNWEALLLLIPALAVVVPAGVMAVLGSFDGLYGQDSFAYYDYATGPLRESLLHGEMPPPFFWPPGYPLPVALLSLLIGTTPLTGQLVSLAAGGLVPVFTALLARELCISIGLSSAVERPSLLLVPLLAGLVTGLTPQLWQSSFVAMADTTGLAAATLGMWSLARYGRGGRLAWLGLASGAIAWAVLTRWAYALVAIPAVVYALVVLARRPVQTALVHAASAFLVAGAILGPTVVPGVLHLALGSGDTAFVGNLEIYSWNPLNALRREFVTADGILRYPLPNGLYYALLPAHWFYLTPIMALAILPGLWFGARRRSALFALIVGWALVVYAFHAGAPWQNFRFVLAFLPPLAILVAIGFAETQRVASRPLRWIAALALAAGLIWMFAGGVSLSREFIERKQADLATVHWMDSQVPSEARLLTFSLTLTVQHYSPIPTQDLFEIDPSTMSKLLADRAPVFVLVDIASIETQWAGRSPFSNYVWLRDGPGLTTIGRSGQYTLFEVDR